MSENNEGKDCDAGLEAKVIEVLRGCYDPEIPVNIYDLGLVYSIDVEPEGAVRVEMTLTAPSCPVAGSPCWAFTPDQWTRR